uniref:Sarcoglycan alpha n=1 Tax=Nothoprocta perdicaria TaxID=30464 RepID=A0A8C6ZE14_NOTPE
MGKVHRGAALAACPPAAPALGGASLPELRLSAATGAVFVHELQREPFEEAFVAAPAVPVGPTTFHAHLGGRPDLPRWLRFAQRHPSAPAYLYGSPTDADAGTHSIEVGAGGPCMPRWGPPGPPRYQGEFLVTDRDVEELLPAATRRRFAEAARGVWERRDLAIVNVTSALHRGARVPLPIEGRKEGVYVTVGSHGTFSQCLVAAASPQSRLRCRLGQQPVATCYDTFAPRFSIAWCNLSLVRHPAGASPQRARRRRGAAAHGGRPRRRAAAALHAAHVQRAHGPARPAGAGAARRRPPPAPAAPAVSPAPRGHPWVQGSRMPAPHSHRMCMDIRKPLNRVGALLGTEAERFSCLSR